MTSRDILARCLAELGAFTEGLAHGEEGLRIAEAGLSQVEGDDCGKRSLALLRYFSPKAVTKTLAEYSTDRMRRGA